MRVMPLGKLRALLLPSPRQGSRQKKAPVIWGSGTGGLVADGSDVGDAGGEGVGVVPWVAVGEGTDVAVVVDVPVGGTITGRVVDDGAGAATSGSWDPGRRR
jgi:hypothetical protein